MSKYGKEVGIPKAADQRRVDTPECPRQGMGKRRKKEYPPHWKVSLHNFGYTLDPHREPCKIAPSWCWDGDAKRNRYDLPGLLAWAAATYPETATMPVRFINCQPIECGREVIPN